MAREEEIDNAKTAFYERVLGDDYYYDPRDCFEEGAKWADSHPKSLWISVDKDLPCNHEELIDKNFKSNFIKTLFVVVWYDNHEDIDCMISENGEWRWLGKKPHTHWMLIPKPPKVGD